MAETKASYSNSNHFQGQHQMSDPSFDASIFKPEHAAAFVQELIGIDASQLVHLASHLQGVDEDPVLVLQMNPEWTAANNQQAANAVLDAIAQFRMQGGHRRDVFGYRWIYHFKNSQEIHECRAALLATHPHAFSLSPTAVATAVAAGAVGVASIPMASTAIIHKIAVREDDIIHEIAVREDDVEPFQFFYQ
eukprot:TRINITY_DN5701_c0_g1_i4.p1 TRINITY_DN5701_c0_g1~~TRINITY_DN5701_c0_g1_i4.p1  ORF type:complete len:192 (-),score=23.17 TRINITY_DN5701_c0_g1_i4:58-633(-)